ncbi:MAG: dihydropteroate synthase [Epsilonproteobacteria bacterium]|nr:dihydropteroate synthase [Campylobacterota bacterium]
MNFFQIDDYNKIKKMIAYIGTDTASIKLMAPKAKTYAVLLKKIKSRDANIIKQLMLSAGADAACAKGVIDCSVKYSDVLLFGTLRQLEYFTKSAEGQTSIVRKASSEIKQFISSIENPPSLRSINQKMRRPAIMGILNVTPDSFSDGGEFFKLSTAVAHAKKMIADEADIIDIGGESTRPGSLEVSEAEQIKRVVPVIEAIRAESDIPISIDARKCSVIEAAVKAGAGIINDVSAAGEEKTAEFAAENGIPIIIMHAKGTPENMQKAPYYDDTVTEITQYLQNRAAYLIDKGVRHENIIVDPGIGFGKRLSDNLAIINNLENLKQLGFLILIGLSRKSFLGEITGDNVKNREAQTLIANFAAISHGADIIRVHNVKDHIKAKKLYLAINDLE